MQLASTASPRSANNSATCSKASGYRKYQRTAVRITSPEYWRPLNGLAAVIDMPYRTKSAHSNFAMEPSEEPASRLVFLLSELHSLGAASADAPIDWSRPRHEEPKSF